MRYRGDRIDVLEGRVQAVLGRRPDNVIAETGMLREFRGGAFRSRFGQNRADLKHQPLDLLLWAAPYLAMAGGLYLAGRAISGQRASSRAARYRAGTSGEPSAAGARF